MMLTKRYEALAQCSRVAPALTLATPTWGRAAVVSPSLAVVPQPRCTQPPPHIGVLSPAMMGRGHENPLVVAETLANGKIVAPHPPAHMNLAVPKLGLRDHSLGMIDVSSGMSTTKTLAAPILGPRMDSFSEAIRNNIVHAAYPGPDNAVDASYNLPVPDELIRQDHTLNVANLTGRSRAPG